MFRPLPFFRFLCVLTLLLTPPATRFAAAQGADVDLGDVLPTRFAATVIAIPEFDASGPVRGVDLSVLHETIYNDLEMFSRMRRVENQDFVRQAHAQDLRTNGIEFAEWRRLDANFVLKGSAYLEEGGDTLVVDVLLYETAVEQRVFGLRFRYAADKARRLAHVVSDRILKEVLKVEDPLATTQILFVRQTPGSKTKEIWLADIDGANARPLTADNRITATPCWGYKAAEVYYTSYKDWNPDLYRMELATQRVFPVSKRYNLNYAPNWNPRTERICLTLGKDGNSEIYTMDRSGRDAGLRRLTYVAGIDSSPCWNPGGNRIVFTSNRTGSPQIHVMDAEGIDVRRLTRMGSYNDSAVWSPKGDRIAYVARDRGVFDVYVMQADGSGVKQLTSGEGNNEDPSWAPDGEHLIFSSNRTGQYHLYVMRSDGSNVHQITREGKNQSPAWSPVETNW